MANPARLSQELLAVALRFVEIAPLLGSCRQGPPGQDKQQQCGTILHRVSSSPGLRSRPALTPLRGRLPYPVKGRRKRGFPKDFDPGTGTPRCSGERGAPRPAAFKAARGEIFQPVADL